MEHVVESSFIASWQPNINRVRKKGETRLRVKNHL
jgi:hypothetical protein